MRTSVKYFIALLFTVGVAFAGADDDKSVATFSKPVQLQVDGAAIGTEEPGYAAPCWADMDGDGRKDLIVGQFAGGKMKVYKNLGDGKFGPGEWLKAGGKTAQIPGVW